LSRRSLYQLEVMFSRTLDVWDRAKARKASSKISFKPAYLLPPEELPIQGLMMPQPPKREKKEQSDETRRSFSRASKKRKPPRKFSRGRNREKALKTRSKAISFLCKCCDYRDNLTNKCLILRLGGTCPYMNSVYSHMPKKAIEIPI